jgi:nucleotide-binding universal stress UspA family protein
MFERIVVGVDGSAESLEAVRQSDVLLGPDGRLVLVAAVDLTDTIHFRVAPTAIHAARHALQQAEELDRRAADALERARAEVTRSRDVVASEAAGPAAACVLDAAAAEHADLVAVGTHGVGRVAGILLGSVATRVLHDAQRSVLVARRPADGAWSPRTIVVGLDGSPQADAAHAAARDVAARFDAELRPLTVEHGRAAHALVEAAGEADLLVVGSRGVHGARALGSVSERVAHEAPCSVLVVRGPAGGETADAEPAAAA